MVLSRVRRAVTDASRRPALLVLCGLVGAGEAATWLLVVLVLDGAPTGVVVGLVLAQRGVLLGVLAALLPGIYAVAREDHGDGEGADTTRSVGAGLRTAVDRADAAAPRLFVSLAASRVVATGLGLAVALVLIGTLGVVDTAVVWTEAYLGVGTDRATLATLGVSGAVVLPSLLARGAVGLHDLAAIDGEHAPIEAPLWSLRSWRGNFRDVLAYTFVRATLLGLPLAAVAIVLVVVGAGAGPLLAGGPAPGALAGVALVGTTAPTRAVLACYQTTAYERATAAEDEGDSDAAGLPRGRRAVLAGVVLVAAIAGAAVVRAADVHPQPDDVPDDVVPANARATVETAMERTAARDRFLDQRTEIQNPSGQWVTVNRFEALLDHTDRQLMFYGHVGSGADARDHTIYATDGRFGTLRSATPPAPPAPHYLRFERGSWSELVGPPYGWAVDDPTADPPADAGWRLVETTGDRLVYRIGGDGLDAATFRDLVAVPTDEAVSLGDGARVTLVVDRANLTVRRMSARATLVGAESADGGEVRLRWERQVNWLGDVEVRRPGSLPSPGVLALFWDAVYY